MCIGSDMAGGEFYVIHEGERRGFDQTEFVVVLGGGMDGWNTVFVVVGAAADVNSVRE